MRDFSGIWVPLVTPFTNDNAVDLTSLRALVSDLVGAGIHGFVVCGTTGEPAALNTDEKQAVLETVLSSCANARVVMGVSGITPSEVCQQLQCWNGYPLAGLLITPPYYVRPSQRGIIEFYTEIAKATSHPIVVYDIPYRTGIQIELATLRTLATIPGIRAIKDCGGDARKTQVLIADQQLQVLAGDDHMIFTTLCQGGAGAITASAHLHPTLFVALFQAVADGRWLHARKIHHSLAPLINTLFAEPSPAPLKSVLAHLECMSSKVRSPMVEVTASTARDAQLAYAHVSTPDESGTDHSR
jgi:4-hydroxy-tetrahydrodipicolinate synthase